ncbi:MAG: hypothetical protein AAFS07_08210 [Pseudomonadota bacterium]
MTFGCAWQVETPGPTTLRNDDPYGRWLLGHGRDFAIRRRVAREDPADFTAEFVCTTTIEDGQEPANLTETALVPADTPITGDGAREVTRIPAPLRQSSIGSGDIPSVTWAPPAAFAGLTAETRERLAQEMVVMAVIDDGMNIAHQRFRGPRGSARVEFAWLQDSTTDGRLPFGREWRRAEIEAAIQQSGGDEERLLSDLDLVTFKRKNTTTVARRVSHGTHMMDLAAGYGAEDHAVDPEIGFSLPALRPIISVHLPFLMTQEASGATYGPFVQEGMRYVFQRVRDMSKALGVALPVVINFSYAVSAGPHNGMHFVERQIRQERRRHLQLMQGLIASDGLVVGRAQRRMVTVVLPAGNRHEARGHARAEAAPQGETMLTLPWRIQPGDQTSSYLEIWLPREAEATQVTIKAPGGTEQSFALPATPADDWQDWLLHAPGSGDVVARLSTDAGTDATGWPYHRRRILLAVAPTEVNWVARAPAPAGLWQVQVSAVLAPDERIDAWVQRDESPYRFRANARQSYLDDPDYQRFDSRGFEKQDDTPEATVHTGGVAPAPSVVRRAGSMSGMATGKHITVVGALRQSDKEPSVYSAAGTIPGETDALRESIDEDAAAVAGRPATIRGPRLMAVADRSRARPGVLAAGSRSGSVVAITGTSAAAPQIARHLADTLSSLPPDPTDAPTLADTFVALQAPAAVDNRIGLKIERDEPHR